MDKYDAIADSLIKHMADAGILGDREVDGLAERFAEIIRLGLEDYVGHEIITIRIQTPRGEECADVLAEKVMFGGWTDDKRIYVHENPRTGAWAVSEAATGRAISQFHMSKQAALKAAEERLSKITPEIFDDRVKYCLDHPTYTGFGENDG